MCGGGGVCVWGGRLTCVLGDVEGDDVCLCVDMNVSSTKTDM